MKFKVIEDFQYIFIRGFILFFNRGMSCVSSYHLPNTFLFLFLLLKYVLKNNFNQDSVKLFSFLISPKLKVDKSANWSVIPSDPGRREIVFWNEGTGSRLHRLTHEPCNTALIY